VELAGALALIRQIPDFPQKGILFQDIAPMLADGQALSTVIKAFAGQVPAGAIVAGIEARGFIFGSAIAHEKMVGFVPIRKAGKLPGEVFSQSYGLEYGSDVLEVQKDALKSGQQVALIDDVLATGGTIEAAIALLQLAGSVVTSVLVLLEIDGLGGRAALADKYPGIEIISLVTR
jgi:adenine phosphoribosyltransferase